MMTPEAADKNNTSSLSTLSQLIRIQVIICLISAATILIICVIFGWRSSENIGSGFIYGSLCLGLCSVLTFAGNTVPAQLSQLSLPKYKTTTNRRRTKKENDDVHTRDERIRLFLMILICSAFLFATGIIMQIIG